jgi:3-oxoacyl-[acyl-carrier-protein] synthase III
VNAVIQTTAVVTDRSIRSSIGLAAAAGTQCLERAGITVDDVDLLINVGVYRDNNMVEPAMAALIQKQIGISLDYVKNPARKAAFGVDLMNGACGVLNAMQVASAFVTTGGARYVLIVSSDIHPSTEDRAEFPYVPVGGAMLVAASDQAGGIGRLSVRESNSKSLAVAGYYKVQGTEGRHEITIRRDPEFAEQLLSLATANVREYVAAEGIDLARTLLVTSQITPDFGARLAGHLGVAASAVATTGIDGDPHTSALTAGFHAATEAGKLSGFDQVLFVGVGAGPTAACVVVRR